MGTNSKRSVIFGGIGTMSARIDPGSSITDSDVFDFDRTDDFGLSLGLVLLREEAQTMCGKHAAATTEGYSVSWANGQFFFTIRDTGGGEAIVSAGAVDEYAVGTEVYLAVTREGSAGNDASNSKIFIDGVDVTNVTPVADNLTTTVANSGTFQYSGIVVSTERFINGIISWMCVWSSLPTPAEMLAIYNAGDLADPLIVKPTGLVAFYPLTFGPFNKSGPGDNHLVNVIANGETTAATNVELVDFSTNNALGAGSNVGVNDTPVSTGLGGISNRCFGPQGTTERFNVTDALATAIKFGAGDTWSLSYWYFDTGVDGNTQIIMGKRLETPSFKGWDTRRRGSNKKLALFICRDNATSDRLFAESDNSFADSSWHHMLWTVDGSDTEAGILLYVDGVSEPLTGAGGSLSASFDTTEDFKMGGFASPLRVGTQIAEVQFFNTVIPITAAAGITSAATLHNSGAPTYPNDWYGPQAPVYYSRLGEEFTHLDLFSMSDEDVLEVGFGSFGSTPPASFKMRARDAGRSPGSDYIVWIHVGDEPDFAGAGYATGSPTPIGALVAGSVVKVATLGSA